MKINKYLALGLALGILIGFILGMIGQQMATRATIAEVVTNFENFEVNIDLNETKLVNEMNETFLPVLKEVFQEGVE